MIAHRLFGDSKARITRASAGKATLATIRLILCRNDLLTVGLLRLPIGGTTCHAAHLLAIALLVSDIGYSPFDIWWKISAARPVTGYVLPRRDDLAPPHKGAGGAPRWSKCGTQLLLYL